MAKKNKLTVWLEYLPLRAIFALMGAVPRGAAVKLGLSVIGLLMRAVPKLRRTAFRNLEIAFPEMDAAEKKRMVGGVEKSLGRVLGEMSHFGKLTKTDLAEMIEFRFDPETQKQYDEYRAAGRGTIIISPHLGNWELLVFAWSALREPISYLARPLDNPKLEELTVSLRTRFGNRPINKTNAVSTAINILREGGTLGILADVNTHPKEGVFVPFFGVPACTTSGPAMLAMRTGAVIIPVCGVWDETAGKYVAVHGKIIEPTNTGDRKADIVTTTAAFTAEVEKLVRAYPEQWMWIHKRWKTRPPGEPGLY
jgi:KDO2-lipid IV(A) lauroyltransferase